MPRPDPSREGLLTLREAITFCGVSAKVFRSRVLPGLPCVDFSKPEATRRTRRFRPADLDARLNELVR